MYQRKNNSSSFIKTGTLGVVAIAAYCVLGGGQCKCVYDIL